MKYGELLFGTWIRTLVLEEGEGPTSSTTLPTRRGTLWSGGRSKKGRAVKTLASISLALSSPSIHPLGLPTTCSIFHFKLLLRTWLWAGGPLSHSEIKNKTKQLVIINCIIIMEHKFSTDRFLQNFMQLTYKIDMRSVRDFHTLF
jgi:hypothetical protein